MGLPVLFAQILYQPAFFTRRSVAMARDLVICLPLPEPSRNKNPISIISPDFFGLLDD
jgi:hypothetical protein